MTLSDGASVALAFSGRMEVSTESVAVSYFALRIGNSSPVPVQITSLMRDASAAHRVWRGAPPGPPDSAGFGREIFDNPGTARYIVPLWQVFSSKSLKNHVGLEVEDLPEGVRPARDLLGFPEGTGSCISTAITRPIALNGKFVGWMAR